MSITFRNYTNKMRFTEDFHKVWKFLERINNENITTPNFLWARWEWMFSLPYIDEASLSQIGIWEDDGIIVALATYETNLGEVYFCVDSHYSYLKSEMLTYARLKLKSIKDNNFRALIPNDDREMQKAALTQGFLPTQNKECTSVIYINDSLNYKLPDGFHISSMADEYNFSKLERCFWRGFNHEGEPSQTEQARREHETSSSGPHWNGELNMKVIAPNGDYAAYCGIWYKKGADYALVEPVCTDPQYRRMGCGKAAVLEAVKRCGELGAIKAFVGSSQQFYYSIGFCPYSTETWWELINKE
ncbi:MAG: GCN5-related N-acetyltransferase [Clostridia bacterium]|nr:GCN5-related N-acetyltransferase [Clostridia bacterium]